METNKMNNEEMVLTKDELQQVSGGHSVKCIGCGAVISSPFALTFNAKVKTHNRYCVKYQQAIRENKTYWGATNLYAYLYR